MPASKKTVLQIIDRLSVGGAERILVNLSNLLSENGHQVTVVTLVEPGILQGELNPQIRCCSLNRKWKWNPVKMYRLVKIAKQHDIIHVHSAPNLRYLYLAAKLFFLRKEIFFQEHYGNVVREKISWHKKLLYPAVNFIAVSGEQARWALEKMKIPRKRIFLLPGIVRKLPVTGREAKSPAFKKILLVSNFLPVKNIGFAVLLAEKLQQSGKFPCTLTIAGQPYDRVYFETILQNIRDKQLEKIIRIVPDCNNIQPLLGGYDLALHTSVSESGPLVLLEYLAFGLPFVCFRTGEIATIVQREFPELVMEGFDPEEWLARIEQVLEGGDATLSNRLSSHFTQNFSEEITYRRCMEIYERGSSSA